MAWLGEKIKYYKENNFVRNVASLQAGSFLGNFIQALAGIFIARMLQPQLFGVYALAFGLASLASIFLGSGIQDAMATVLGGAYARKDGRGIGEAFGFLVKMTIITGFISIIVICFLPFIAGHFYHSNQIGLYSGTVVIASILSTLFFSFSQIALQLIGKIRPMTLLIVADQTIRYGLSLLLVYFGFGLWGAALGHLFGATIIFIISAYVWEWARKNDRLLPSIRKLLAHIKDVSLKKYFSYSIWVAIDRNMGNLYMALPVVLAGVFLLTKEVTYFKLSFGFVNLALSLLGPISVLLNVEFPKMQVKNEDIMARNFIKVSLYSIGLSVMLTLGAIIISPIAFKILYGDSFMPSVKYISGLIVYGGLFGIGVGLGPMWRALNKVKISILINTIVLGLGIPLGLILIRYLGVWGAVVMVTIWFSISHIASFIYLYKELKSGRA